MRKLLPAVFAVSLVIICTQAFAGVAVVLDPPLDPYTGLAALHGQQKASELAAKGEYTVVAVHQFTDGNGRVVVTLNPDEHGIYLPSANVKVGDKVKLIVDVRPYGLHQDATLMWDLSKPETWLRIYIDGLDPTPDVTIPVFKDGETVTAAYKFNADDLLYAIRFYTEAPELSDEESASGIKITAFIYRERP